MSGGSYNYLEDASDIGMLAGKKWDLQQMAERLEDLRPGHPATVATRQLATLLLTEVPPWLREVWHAVEWADSCDWGDQQRDAVLDQHTDPSLRPPPLTKGA